jgi:SAM-dependent methyltransferase
MCRWQIVSPRRAGPTMTASQVTPPEMVGAVVLALLPGFEVRHMQVPSGTSSPCRSGESATNETNESADFKSDRGIRHGTWRSLQRRAAPRLQLRLDQLRQESLGRLISALEEYLLSCLCDQRSAREFVNRLPEIYGSCNDNIYERPMVAEAYAYIHMVGRYCNWWDTFIKLFAEGWLPMRESGLRVLDVGAGPGPATYAFLDFSRALNRAILDFDSSDELQALRTPGPYVVMVESSWAMSHFVHRLSEERGLGGPYEARFDDFFGLRLVRTREMNAELRRSLTSQIMEEWDVGPMGAEWILRKEYVGWHEPDRYHLCLISHFLTLDTVLAQAAEALRGVKRTLSPGGVIAVVGTQRRGETYGPIHRELDRQMHGLTHLDVSGIGYSDIDERSQAMLNAFYLKIRDRISDLGIDIDAAMTAWPNGIPRLVAQRWKPSNRPVFPPFMLEAFRAAHHRKTGQRSR